MSQKMSEILIILQDCHQKIKQLQEDIEIPPLVQIYLYYKSEVFNLISRKEWKEENFYRYDDYDVSILSFLSKDYDYRHFMKNEKVMIYLIDHMDLESLDSDKSRPIHYICQYSIARIVRYIIEKGVELESEGFEKKRPIHLACQFQPLEIIQYMVEKKVNINSKSNFGFQPIHIVCTHRESQIIKYLLDQNIDLESETIEGYRPIHMIARYSDTESLRHIIGKGVDMQCKIKSGLDFVDLLIRNRYRN